MASIPSNGYNEVMAGTNNYTGSNSYDADCPKTAIVPVASDDLCNKLYVDAIVGGGTVVSVSGGTNIVMSGTIPAPIVNLLNPLTAELNVGTQSIRDRTSSVGTSGQVLTAGTGGQVLWGAGTAVGVTSITAGLNIGIDSTVPAAPVVRVLQPLTSVLDIGTQNITGTTGYINMADTGVPATQSITRASSVSVLDTTSASIYAEMTKAQLIVNTATSGITISNSTIAKTGVPALTISSLASNIALNTPNVVTTSGSFQPATILDTFASAAGTVGQVLSSLGGAGTKWVAAGGGGGGTLDATLALGNTATGTYANITLTDTAAGGSANPILTLVNTDTSPTSSVALEVFKDKGSAGLAGEVLYNQSIYGKDAGNAKQEYTRITHSIRDNTVASEDGSIEFACVRAGTMETFVQFQGVENEVNFQKPIDMVGNNIRTSTGSMTLTTALSSGLGNITNTAKAGIFNTASNGAVSTTATTGISSTTSTGNVDLTATAGNISLTTTAPTGGISMTAGTTGGIVTNQTTNTRTILRTGHTNAFAQNLDYYPSYVVENTGALTTNVSLPYMPFQNLLLVNSGVSPTFVWTDTPDPLAAASATAFIRASSGQYWVGIAGFIYVYSSSNFALPPDIIYDIQAAGEVNVFYESNGFMFVGGIFTGVVGEPQAQFSLMRFSGSNTTTPLFDPMFDSVSSIEGFSGNINAITADAGNNTLYVGGLFAATVPSPIPLENLCIVGNCFGASGSQTYSNDVSGFAQFAANGEIYAMMYYNGNVYYGGDFSNVASGLQNITNAAFYTPAWATIPSSSNGTIGQGGFNAPLTSFQMAVNGSGILLFTGSFNFTEASVLIKYGGYIDTASPLILNSFGIPTLGVSTHPNCMNTGGTLNILIQDDNQVWYGTDENSWEDGGIANPTDFPNGITYDGSFMYAIFQNYHSVRKGSPSTASTIFELPSEAFKTSAGSFKKATLPEYASQLFVADINGTYYHAVGTPIATFSN
jgi:hypothetical protein